MIPRFNPPPAKERADTHQDTLPRVSRTPSDAATPFGCCSFFDPCSPDIFSLYYRNGLGLLDWMGFNPTPDCYRSVNFISYVRPEQYNGSDTAGYLSDPCTEPNGIEFGSCKLSVEDFGLYGRIGPNRNLFKPERYCKTMPRYLFDGQPVTKESDWDMTFTMDAMLNDVRTAIVTGNATTPGQFDGLQRWVKTGYNCEALDSYVVNWNANGMDGGAGITLNGVPVAGSYNIVDWLLDLNRNINQRIGWSPVLRNQNKRTGDKILLMPSFMARCLLDFFACWSVCPGAQYEEVIKNMKEINEYRLTLNGGMFGNGQISLDGETIPILAYDWGLINGPTRGDMYLLTGSVGSQRIWEGEHLSAENVMGQLIDGTQGFFSLNGGRVLGKEKTDELCREIELWMALRLWCMAPWAQVRIQNVVCRTPSGPLSPSPADSSFYPISSFVEAECPEGDPGVHDSQD